MLKRFLLVLLTVVLLFALNVNVLAGSVVDDVTDRKYYSYWNIDALFITYTSGQYAVFDFPTNFLLTEDTIEQTVVLESRDLTHELSFMISFVDADSSSYFDIDTAEVVFDFTGIESIDVVMTDSILSPDVLLGEFQQIPGLISVPYWVGDSSMVEAFSYTYSYMYPDKGSSEYAFTFSEGSYTASYTSLQNVPYSSMFYLGLTPDNLQEVVSLFTDQGYSTSQAVPYFYHSLLSFELTHSLTNPYMGFVLPLTHSPYPLGTFYRSSVSNWIDLYFHGYNDLVPLDYNFASFIGDVLGGFFQMELFYGITIGAIILAIFAVFFVRAFLNYFAGG